MAKDKDNLKFGDIVASNISLEKANKIRSFIKRNTESFWIFVVRNSKTGKYNVSAQNTWGGSLDEEELNLIKSTVKKAKEELKAND